MLLKIQLAFASLSVPDLQAVMFPFGIICVYRFTVNGPRASYLHFTLCLAWFRLEGQISRFGGSLHV